MAGLTRKEAAKAAWMAKFESEVSRLDSRHTGKIEWANARHMYNQELTATMAAENYVGSRKYVEVAKQLWAE